MSLAKQASVKVVITTEADIHRWSFGVTAELLAGCQSDARALIGMETSFFRK
jgi:hypothetical protein